VSRAIIAIDGPAGSGKTTVSRAIADRLGWSHLDTGAFYRAAAVAVDRAGVDRHDEQAVAAVVAGSEFDQKAGRMFLDGEDVSDLIRTDEASAGASVVSAHPAVRRILVQAQRRWASDQPGGAVAEGRDMGTVVFPEAGVKVFLTADPAERARRRALEQGADERTIATAMAERDRLDMTRAASPLEPAADAAFVDTTGLGIDEVVDRLAELAAEAGLT
jgi:CMP/dCMP kinase